MEGRLSLVSSAEDNLEGTYITGGFLIVPPHFQYRYEKTCSAKKTPTMEERPSLASSVEDNMGGEK